MTSQSCLQTYMFVKTNFLISLVTNKLTRNDINKKQTVKVHLHVKLKFTNSRFHTTRFYKHGNVKSTIDNCFHNLLFGVHVIVRNMIHISWITVNWKVVRRSFSGNKILCSWGKNHVKSTWILIGWKLTTHVWKTFRRQNTSLPRQKKLLKTFTRIQTRQHLANKIATVAHLLLLRNWNHRWLANVFWFGCCLLSCQSFVLRYLVITTSTTPRNSRTFDTTLNARH